MLIAAPTAQELREYARCGVDGFLSQPELDAHTLHDALDLWEKSELAREAFGAEVVEHYANYARVELTAYEAAVTDWELRRGFERL